MVKSIFISGSPRKGNTDYILQKVFDSIKGDKELIFLREKNIKHCIGCLSCHNNPKCVIKDDMDDIRSKMLNSDFIVIGTPNYFDNVTGLLKDFIDRTHPLYTPTLLKGKKLILIMVGGGEVEGSAQYLRECTDGFVKYQELDLIGSYCFQGLNPNDVEKDSDSESKIQEIIEEISRKSK